MAGQKTLFRKGSAIHRRFIFDIYELTLYLQHPNYGPEEIISSCETKFARLKFLRDLKAGDIRDGFEQSFRENCLSHCENLSPQLKVFLESIHDMSEGSVIEFSFHTDKTVISMLAKNTVTFPGIEFGKIFLRSWVGSAPPSERFRRDLLGICR